MLLSQTDRLSHCCRKTSRLNFTHFVDISKFLFAAGDIYQGFSISFEILGLQMSWGPPQQCYRDIIPVLYLTSLCLCHLDVVEQDRPQCKLLQREMEEKVSLTEGSQAERVTDCSQLNPAVASTAAKSLVWARSSELGKLRPSQLWHLCDCLFAAHPAYQSALEGIVLP